MRAGHKRLQDILTATLSQYPAIEAQLPAKVTALRRALSDRLDLVFEAPTETNSGTGPERSRRCKSDRSIFVDAQGRAVSRIHVDLRGNHPPLLQTVRLTATLTVWTANDSWFARVDSNEPLDADHQVDALAAQLLDALETKARSTAIGATADRGVYSPQGGEWGTPGT